jgi:alginate O-acetyltransferase complex protein AlgI
MRDHWKFELPGLIGWTLTSIFLIVSWIFFRSDTVTGALSYLGAMFGGGHATEQIFSIAFYLTPDKMLFLGVGALISVFPIERFKMKMGIATTRTSLSLRTAALLCFFYSVSLIAANGFNPFIYFRF